MDILLIIITLVIVMGIAYILSRPFAHLEPAAETPGDTQNVEQQYEDLIREIKTLQDECDHLETPEEICRQIEEKKQLAANLLRQISAAIKEQPTPYRADESIDPEETQPENPFLHDSLYVCPQCGGHVATSDKFCTHCGNRLQP